MVYKKIFLFSVNILCHLKPEIVSTIPASNDKKWKQVASEKSRNRKNAPQNTIYIIRISFCKWDHPAFGVCVYYVKELVQWLEL